MYRRRHNQDLQKELSQAKSQINHLRTMLDNATDRKHPQGTFHTRLSSPGSPQVLGHKLPQLSGKDPARPHMASLPSAGGQRPSKRRRTSNTAGLSNIGRVIAAQARGIFKSPYPPKSAALPTLPEPDLPALPSRAEADTLIAQYRSTLHPVLPMLHWPSFHEKYDAVYEAKSLRNVSHSWIALLYAVFACGSICDAIDESLNFLETSRKMIDLWDENLTLDHARVVLLTSICLVEMNRKTAGWIWVGLAIRICFDIGLHCEAGVWSAVEEEMRRRVWWCVYTCDW